MQMKKIMSITRARLSVRSLRSGRHVAVAVLFALISLTSRRIDAVAASPAGPLVATVRPLGTPVRAGDVAIMQVEIKNVSASPVAFAIDEILRSHFFTTQSEKGGSLHGAAEGWIRDPKKDGQRCPGDFPTFLVEPGRSLVHLVGVPIPRTLRGDATLHLVLQVLHVRSPPRCSPGDALNLPATASLKVSTGERRRREEESR
jgi:hypothetical protein